MKPNPHLASHNRVIRSMPVTRIMAPFNSYQSHRMKDVIVCVCSRCVSYLHFLDRDLCMLHRHYLSLFLSLDHLLLPLLFAISFLLSKTNSFTKRIQDWELSGPGLDCQAMRGPQCLWFVRGSNYSGLTIAF
jgi:hypothetical protein